MTDHEYETCKAEAEYDFQREERMLTADDHKDNSRWQDMLNTAAKDRDKKWKEFLINEVPYWSTAMCQQARRDLKDELDKRIKPDAQQSDFYERLQETVVFMEDAKNYDSLNKEPF